MKLYDFQETGVEFIKEHKYVLLGDEMGLGKTVQALVALEDEDGPVLVVCPAFLRKNWESEVENLASTRRFPFDPCVCRKVEDFQNSLFDQDTIFICSYDMLRQIPPVFKPKHVIFDEAHYLKNLKAARSQYAHKLVAEKKPETCVLLSGTPIKNRIPEFYSLLGMLSYCPSRTNGIRLKEKSQYAFNLKFTHPTTRTIYVKDQVRDITEFHGVRNIDTLKAYFKGKYIRRLAKAVLGLPPLITKEIQFGDKLKNDKEYLQAYATFEETGVFPTLKADLARAKVKHTCAYALEIVEQGEPVVIFSDHLVPVEEISKFFTKKGIVNVSMTGKTLPHKREDYVSAFQSGEVQVLIATIGSSSVGYTMTRARNLIFNDYPWVPSDIDQARKRIHRIGQVNRCVIHMVLGSKVDKRILETVKSKKLTIEKVI